MEKVDFKVGDVLDINKAVYGCREYDIQQIFRLIKSSGYIWMSWGMRSPVIEVKDKSLRFRVNGHHHKGTVHIVLDFMDTFTIYYTTLIKNQIVKIREGVYIEDLIDILDSDIERISEYRR